MALNYVSVIAVFVLIAWRLMLLFLRRRHFARAVAAPWERRNNVLERGMHALRRADLAVNADNGLENGSDGSNSVGPKDRAETYLRRVVALTGAKESGRAYILDVGRTRFKVRDRFVTRFQDHSDPKSSCQETCFYPVHDGMPKAEEIATALLQLASNPALFDKWAVQKGRAFKANGKAFN